MPKNNKQAIIIGAGPAGLTAAYELVKKGIKPIIIERDSVVGGIARTVQYKDYRFDIGGHRFFTKNSEVERLWKEVLGESFLVRPRLSRWYFKKKFFDYPIKPLQVVRLFGIESAIFMLSFLKYKLFPIKPEISAADWYTNQFGLALSKPFFIRYNEKLWGIPCSKLSMDFGKQRVKGVSFFSVIVEHMKKTTGVKSANAIKSLIDEFYYPKYGPGMMWEKFREIIEKKGGKFLMESEVVKIERGRDKVKSIVVQNKKGKLVSLKADYFLTSLPLKELVARMNPPAPKEIIDAANALKFRAFTTAALIINKEKIFPDTWIYTHDAGMRCIRIQNFNNWSPYMTGKKGQTCIGFEYVCNFGDKFWNLSEEEVKKIAVNDLILTGFARAEDVADAKVIKLKEVYPVYDLEYKKNAGKIRDFLKSSFKNNNIQPIGRGGMHKYNNMDHSMMTALIAARNIIENKDCDAWNVNADAEYHEEKK